MAKMKKAVLLTLGMLLLSSIVFSLSILILHNTQGTEDRFAELSLYDRLYDLDSSIQRGFKEIFTRNSGITLTIVDGLVTITETLPYSSNFEAEMEAYKTYLEDAYDTDPQVTINDAVLTLTKNSLPFYIMPHNILIEHDAFPSGQELRITPQNLNVENYSISLTTSRQSLPSFSADTVPGSLEMLVTARLEGGSSFSQLYNVNPESSNTITLRFDEGEPEQADITITLDNPAHLTINRGSVTTEHNIEIALTHQAENLNYITYPNNLFTINIPGDNLQKTSTARLL